MMEAKAPALNVYSFLELLDAAMPSTCTIVPDQARQLETD